MVVPWVTQAMTPRTQPKQWKKGTGMQSRSFSVNFMHSPMLKPLLIEVEMGQHDPLGEAGGAGGVLHVDGFMAVQGGFDGSQFGVADLPRPSR